MDTLRRSGVIQFGVNLHYLPDLVERTVNRSVYRSSTTFAREPEILGTGGGIANLWRTMKPSVTYLMTVNGDSIAFPLNPEEMLSTMNRAGADVVLLCVPYVRGTTALTFGNDGLLKGVSKENHGWTYTGIQILSTEWINHFPEGCSRLFEDIYLPAVREGRIRVVLHPFHGFWREAGTPLQYLQANLDLLENQGRRAVPPGTMYDPSRNTLIPRGTYMGPDVELHHVILGRGVYLEPPIRMDRTIVLPGVRVASGTYQDEILTPRGNLSVL